MELPKRSTDEVIFVLAAIFFLLSTLLLLDEGIIFKLGRRHNPDLQAVAVMGKKYNDVRRRIITDITWFPALKSDQLYLGDNIFTGPASEATINFSEGSELVLSEETLIVLEKTTERTLLNLKWGMLSGKVKKGQPLSVKIGDQIKTIQSDGAEIQVNRNKDGGFELAVQKGSVEISGKKGEKVQRISTGQAIRSNEAPQATIQKVKYQIELLAPVQNLTLWKDAGSKVEFQWKKTLESKNYVLAVAKDRDFKNIVFYKNVQEPIFRTSDLPALGVLYWRVIDLKNKQTSQTHRFSLFNGEPPYPIAPANNRALVFGLDYKRRSDVKLGEYPVWMQWSYKKTFENFEIEVAKDKKFTEIIKNKQSDSWQKRMDLAEGHYYWRVRVKDDRRPTAAWSPPNKLTVQRVLPAPKINDKVKELKLDKEKAKSGHYRERGWLEKIWNLLIPQVIADEEANSEGMQLNWQKIQDASSYEVIIAKDKDLKEIMEKKIVKTNYYLWLEKQPGVYYWQVRAVNGLGELQKPSEVGKILLTVTSPKITSEIIEISAPLKEQDEPLPIKLEWKPAFKISNYLVETSETKDFRRIKEYLVKNETKLIVLASKTLFWRVTPLDEKDRPVGDKTPRALVEVSYKVPNLFGFIPQIVHGRYTVPTHFDPRPNGISLKTPAIEYDLKSFGLSFGQKQFNPSSLQFQIISNPYSKFNIKFFVPSDFIANSLMEIEGDDKKVVYSQTFDPKKEDLKFDETSKFVINSKILSDLEFKNISSQNQLRLCIRQRLATSKVSSCSAAYKLEESEGQWNTQPIGNDLEPKVLINNKEVDHKGVLVADELEPKEFVAEFEDHSSVEIQAVPPKTDFDEVFLDNEENVIVKGFGDAPYNLIQLKDKKEKEWSIKLPAKQKILYIGAQNGFVWKQEFSVEKSIPSDFDRPYLLIGSKTSTYKDTVALKGKVREDFLITNQSNTVKQNQNLFDWNIQLGKHGTTTTDSIVMSDGYNKHVASYNVYRSYPGEFVSRLTAFKPTENDIWGLTELSASYWFEDIFGSKNYYWSQQRWGITAQSMVNLTAGLFRVSTADLKYRFSPGVWNREESFGFKVGYQSMNYRSVEGAFIGAGAFWTMPSKGLVDKALNVVPVFRKQKVLDIQAMYYPLLVRTRGTLGLNYDLRMNGKIFLKPDFFVEIGLGARQISLTISSTNYVDATLGFCTGGIGWVL